MTHLRIPLDAQGGGFFGFGGDPKIAGLTWKDTWRRWATPALAPRQLSEGRADGGGATLLQRPRPGAVRADARRELVR